MHLCVCVRAVDFFFFPWKEGLFLLPLEIASMVKDKDTIEATKNCRLSPVIEQGMEASISHILKEGLCEVQGVTKAPATKPAPPRMLPAVP